MSGPKRNEDKLNTIGVVVVGICGAVLVYVTITALQAFYMNDTSEIQTMADYGGQDQTARGKKADELRNIGEAAANGGGSYRMKIEDAMKLIVEDAKKDPSHLGGAKLPPSTKESIPPKFGRPAMGGAAPADPAAPADGAGSAAPADGAGSAAPAAGSAAPAPGATGSAAPMTPTGTGPGGAGASPGTQTAPAGSGAPR